jgi:hypothetical protein
MRPLHETFTDLRNEADNVLKVWKPQIWLDSAVETMVNNGATMQHAIYRSLPGVSFLSFSRLTRVM